MRKISKCMVICISLLFVTSIISTSILQVKAANTVIVQFGHDINPGGNMATSEVAIIIDGIPKDGTDFGTYGTQYYDWEEGKTHSISIVTPIEVGWGAKTTYYFVGWDNGNGLVESSGTFTVPSSDDIVTVTALYSTTPPPSPASLTISCSPDEVDKTGSDTSIISGTLTSSGSGVSGKTIDLSYSPDNIIYTSFASVTTGPDGGYSYNWDVPADLANGYYYLEAVFTGDGSYSETSANTIFTGNNLLVLPEHLWGGLAAVIACFAALVIFKTRSSLSPLIHKNKK